ncbi:MAG: SMC family ATPase, partial [Treponemataceae bacterium]|nr:SMC family ATPase [Treponemataceae bacterium]
EISSKIDEENRRQNLLGDKSKKESEIDEQKTMLKSFNDRLSKAQEEDKKKASLIQKQAILKETLPEYQAISEKEEKLLELKKDTEEKESQLAENEGLCSKNKTRFDENKTKIEEIKDCEVKKVEIENQIKGCTQKINETKDLKAKLTELQRDRENHRIATEKYKKSQSSFENANKEYEQKQKLFYAEQAGILAEILKEGEACPVCGSTSHPNLAQKSKEAPSEEEVNRLKGEAEKLRAAFDKIKDETTSLYAAIQEKTKVLDEGIKRQFENLSSEDENLTEKIDEFMAESNAEFEKLEDQQKSNEQNILLKQKLEKENEQIEKQNEAIEKQNTLLRETITKNRTTIENEKKAVEEKKSKLEFETLEKAQSEYQSLSERIAAIEKELDEAMKEKTECENTLHEKEGQLAKIKSDLETMPVQDLASLEEEKEKLDAKRTEKDMQRDEYNSQNTTNSNSLNEIEKLVPEIAAKSKRQTMIRGIYDIASGKNNDKIALETYVQTRFLDEITKYANLRLRVMTDNKYELVRRTEKTGGNGQSGLDFNIKDFYTGKERAVETLSGGEKFQSSLALALGLSDEVQMSSGGIKLDAMFIDEGFGTLDSEALNKAMKALSDLSKNNKQIGIISHVSELEEKIPYKIKVSKDKMTGISSIQIINDI